MAPSTDHFAGGFYFLRHGQTSANRAGIRAGSENDAKLTEFGCKQSHAAARKLLALSSPSPGIIVAANMSRTLNTSRIIRQHLDLRLRIQNEFMERRLGQWNFQSVEATRPLLSVGRTPPGGETEWAFRTRILSAFGGLADVYPNWPLVVSSLGVGRILFSTVGLDLGRDVGNGQLFRVALGRCKPMEFMSVAELGSAGKREIWRSKDHH